MPRPRKYTDSGARYKAFIARHPDYQDSDRLVPRSPLNRLKALYRKQLASFIELPKFKISER